MQFHILIAESGYLGLIYCLFTTLVKITYFETKYLC